MNSPESLNTKSKNLFELITTNWESLDESQKSILTKISNQYDIKIKISGLDQLWSWSFDYDEDYNRKLQTVMTEQMLMNSILFSNRFYPTLGIDSNFYGIFEKKLENAFQKVKIIIDNNDDPINHINYGINKLGIYS